MQTMVFGNTRTTRHVQLVQSCRKNCSSPDDGPMRSETCRAKTCWLKTYSLRPHCVCCWTTKWYADLTMSSFSYCWYECSHSRVLKVNYKVLLFLGCLLREHGASSLRWTELPVDWSSWQKDVGNDYGIWPGCVLWKTRRPRWVLL